MNTYLYILLMAITIFMIRVLPLLLIGSEIKNNFIRSFLYYVPYVTLSLMTFPAMIDATINPIAGVISLLVGTYFAYKEKGLFVVTVIVCVTVLVVEFVF